MVAICLLVGCSSGSWTTVEDPDWVVRRSEAGLVYIDVGPAENCKISTYEKATWSNIEAETPWIITFKQIGTDFAPPDFSLTELRMRNCLGAKYTRNSDLFKDAIYELAERNGVHECRAEIVVFLAKRDRDHEIPRQEEYLSITRESKIDEFGNWISDDQLDEEALENYENAIDEWDKRTELDTQEETNRLLELKKLECEREERKAEQEDQDD
tara:strand:+ start:340 stop:978 length:639 start_codon:yes stop_codon:yes gene_type:complete